MVLLAGMYVCFQHNIAYNFGEISFGFISVQCFRFFHNCKNLFLAFNRLAEAN